MASRITEISRSATGFELLITKGAAPKTETLLIEREQFQHIREVEGLDGDDDVALAQFLELCGFDYDAQGGRRWNVKG